MQTLHERIYINQLESALVRRVIELANSYHKPDVEAPRQTCEEPEATEITDTDEGDPEVTKNYIHQDLSPFQGGASLCRNEELDV